MQFIAKCWNFIKSPGVMAVIAIVSLAFGIYGTLFYEKRPALVFEIISNASVYDVRENLSKLEIFYAGQNLRAEKKTLRLITIRIINTGQTNISKVDYDESDPLGFSIGNGKILEIPKFFGSNEYLKRNIKPILSADSIVRLEPVILDAGEFIEAQALVLTPEGTIPSISPLGKIAGIKQIQVLAANQTKDQSSVWSRITSADSMWIQIARAPIYGLFALVLTACLAFALVIILIPLESVSDARKKHTREIRIKKLAQGRPLMITDQYVLEKYKISGDNGLGRLHKLIERTVQRNNLISKIEHQVDEETLKKILRSILPVRPNELSELEEHHLIKNEGIKLLIDPDLERALREFAGLLEISLENLTNDPPENVYFGMADVHAKLEDTLADIKQ